jgi:hypothetical protein
MNFKQLNALKGVKVEVIITGPFEEAGNIYDELCDGEPWPENVYVSTLIGEDESIEEVLTGVYECIPGRLNGK